MTVVYLVQHGDKQPGPGDPGADRAGPIAGHPDWAAAGRSRGRCLVDQPEAARAGDSRVHHRGDRARGSGRCPAAGTAELGRQHAVGGLRGPVGPHRGGPRLGACRRAVRAAGRSPRLRAFLVSLSGLPGPVAAVTHGGVSAELLRTLIGDDALPPGLLATVIPPCAITTVDDLNPVTIASVSHLQ
jgi:hypothetical protein